MKKRTRRKADALVLKNRVHIGGLMGIGREYVEQKNTAIPLRTAICTKMIWYFIPVGGQPVPALGNSINPPFGEQYDRQFQPSPNEFVNGEIILYETVEKR